MDESSRLVVDESSNSSNSNLTTGLDDVVSSSDVSNETDEASRQRALLSL